MIRGITWIVSVESFRSFRAEGPEVPYSAKPVTGKELFLLFLTANQLYILSYVCDLDCLDCLKLKFLRRILTKFK